MLKLIICSFFITSCFSESRKLSSIINPGCNSECSHDKNVLVHITADGPNDTLHHVWDFTYKPTVLLAVTPHNTALSINWTEFLKGEAGAIQFSSQPLYTFSFVLDQIIEFNDFNNTAMYDPKKINPSDITSYDPHKFEWKFKWDKYENTSKNVFAVLEGINHQHDDGNHKGGTVIVSLSSYGTKEHSKSQPHLLHSVNASQIEIILDSFPTTEHFKSRFAFVFTIASSDKHQSSFNQMSLRSLDDEHSPGVFTVEGVKSSRGYLEWRTVSYTSADRLMTSSTGVSKSLLPLTRNDSLDHTVLFSLFGNELDDMLVSSLVLSFGQPGEAFYSETHYLSWTFLGGIGSPVNDGFSLLVLLILSIGIGLPVLLIIFGGIFTVFKKISKKSQDMVFSES